MSLGYDNMSNLRIWEYNYSKKEESIKCPREININDILNINHECNILSEKYYIYEYKYIFPRIFTILLIITSSCKFL